MKISHPQSIPVTPYLEKMNKINLILNQDSTVVYCNICHLYQLHDSSASLSETHTRLTEINSDLRVSNAILRLARRVLSCTKSRKLFETACTLIPSIVVVILGRSNERAHVIDDKSVTGIFH